MSVDRCASTGCSVDSSGDSGICVETVNSGHKIDSAASDAIGKHHNISVPSPISIDDTGIQSIPSGSTSQTKIPRCSKCASFLPCIRIVVFILIIIVLLLICKMIIYFQSCAEAFGTIIVFLFIVFFFQGLKRKIIKCAFEWKFVSSKIETEQKNVL